MNPPRKCGLISFCQCRASNMSNNVLPSNCPKHIHAGACCKVAVSVYRAYEKIRDEKQNWVYFTDDDAYVVTKHILTGLTGSNM